MEKIFKHKKGRRLQRIEDVKKNYQKKKKMVKISKLRTWEEFEDKLEKNFRENQK